MVYYQCYLFYFFLNFQLKSVVIWGQCYGYKKKAVELIQINVDTNESRGEKLLTKRIEKRMTDTIFNTWSQFFIYYISCNRMLSFDWYKYTFLQYIYN